MFLNHRYSSGFRSSPPSFCVYLLPSPTIFHLISYTVTNRLVIPLLSSQLSCCYFVAITLAKRGCWGLTRRHHFEEPTLLATCKGIVVTWSTVSSSSSESDENQGFSNHIPLTETEPTDGDLFYEFYDDASLFSFDIDEANASVAESDSDSTDNSVEIDVDDNALVVIEENPPQTFKDQLSSWGIDCGVPRVHLNKLLTILKTHDCHYELPSDACSLLKTPRKGLIQDRFLPVIRTAIAIEILINVDGLPIFSKSTLKQLWVILGMIRGIAGLVKTPFVIGVKYHSGKSSCSKCTTTGITAFKPSEIRRLVRPKGRVVFPYLAAPLRDDESFRQRGDPDHHNFYSIVEELVSVDMVYDFPVDPMHLVHEGTGRKLIMTLMEDSDFKISPYSVRRVNKEITALSKFTPRDFDRRAREFSSQMKATEWAQAIGYTAPVVFRNRLSPERYANLLSLHVAIKILTSRRLCFIHNGYAKDLLKVFVQNASLLYGDAFVTFNIHNLIQLADDVMRFGPIYSFSAYAFENFLGIIKRLLRKSEKPLEQIVKRLFEIQMSFCPTSPAVRTAPTLKLAHKGGILLPGVSATTPQFLLLEFNHFYLNLECGNNCVMMSDQTIVKVENFVILSGKPFIIERKFVDLCNFYPAPFDSTMLNIHQCKMSHDLDCWPIVESVLKPRSILLDDAGTSITSLAMGARAGNLCSFCFQNKRGL
ncbi:Uncharacterized protein APZ42_032358 [Daphnia magna]|uniref:Uncharacterized protein n=1 Tax=Daphnia magna TaxID=35525 RepID=A0A164M234_9CRUS|nr:Uncharacterized protein APZ42_032358 [Daphnia magna]